MGEEWVKVYDLARDREYLERLQLATLESAEFALESDHGLPGSGQWWTAIRDGSIPTRVVEGAISDIRVAGNWPEFEVDANGELTTWCLEGDVKSYRVGTGVRVDYVIQRCQHPPETQGENSVKIVLRILLEP
jgi:hypothetical protein